VDQDTRAAGPPVEGERTPEQIQADIERTREEVGDTVEALAHKTDVKAQVHERVEEVKANVKAKTPASAQQGAGTVVAKVKANPMPLVAGGALLAAFLIGRRSGRP
jgi:predicted RNA-binding protein Jag